MRLKQPHLGARGLRPRRVEADQLDAKAMGRVCNHAPELPAANHAHRLVPNVHFRIVCGLSIVFTHFFCVTSVDRVSSPGWSTTGREHIVNIS